MPGGTRTGTRPTPRLGPTRRRGASGICNHRPSSLGRMGIEVVTGDITRLEVDVIVNAANEHLQHGGGVAAAIARAGAPVVDAESEAWVREHGPLGPGEARSEERRVGKGWGWRGQGLQRERD